MSHINVLAECTSKKIFSFFIFVANIFKEILNAIVNPVFVKIYLKKFWTCL
jgi:DNA-binding MltR family transcriptional regulator